MKRITIDFNGGWVLGHRDDEELPIETFKRELGKIVGVDVKGSSFTAIALVIDEHRVAPDDVIENVKKTIAEKFPDAKYEDVVSSYNVVDEEDKRSEIAKAMAEAAERRAEMEKHRQEIREKLGLEFESMAEEERKDEKVEPDGEGVKQKIDALVGAAEFKSLVQELITVSDEIKRTGTQEVFINQSYLFSIGDGYGLTTYLELFSDLIDELKLCDAGLRPVSEERVAQYKESFEPFENATRALINGSPKSPRVLCVDISEWLDKTDNRYFRQFLRLVEKYSKNAIVVFRIPFVEKDILAKVESSLSDVLSVRTVTFPPFSGDEIKAFAENELLRLGFTITKSSWEYFFNRIAEEKSDGKFYGVNTVKKVVRELVYQKHLANAKKQNKSGQITIYDAKALCRGEDDSNLSGYEMLNRLVGVDGIKARVEEIVAQIDLALKEGKGKRPCIHMRFVGNPGTGKTTVARIIGKILKEKGVLRVGAFFEYAGRDFCGRYVGETAPKTTSICRDAYGSVLFIDEAYSLYRGDNDTRDFGREAIDTLIAEMENHRNDLVVIMAGYTDDIEKMMSGNLGLKSRMPYTIEFPNFTREQLYDIFVSMIKGKFKCDNGLFDAARKFFDGLSDESLSSKEFSNARYVRNLFERTWAKAAMRCQLNGKKQVVLTREDFEQASADKEFVDKMPKKSKIGFNI